jgi:hypothetical protein
VIITATLGYVTARNAAEVTGFVVRQLCTIGEKTDGQCLSPSRRDLARKSGGVAGRNPEFEP